MKSIYALMLAAGLGIAGCKQDKEENKQHTVGENSFSLVKEGIVGVVSYDDPTELFLTSTSHASKRSVYFLSDSAMQTTHNCGTTHEKIESKRFWNKGEFCEDEKSEFTQAKQYAESLNLK